jgi:hypothetical protein
MTGRTVVVVRKSEGYYWACSECAWNTPVPEALNVETERREAERAFHAHKCAEYPKSCDDANQAAFQVVRESTERLE